MVRRVPQRKNTIKAKNKKKGTTKATGRSYEYQRRFNARLEQKRKRAELNKENRKRGTYGNKDNKDISHNYDGTIRGFEHQSSNRARNAKNSRHK